ncbi:coiled-coil domain-containing protein 148 [Lingula anatina]|uniref:Coiled-coil domain-containing protein 148 n=1 Tax=Lingula anatina TaxID=7574 RepID=A0A1S3HCR5_LINAN|nr:coiled-coil domain-containing protein 148 [Lingula anatina]XP_013383819.1 coiled-coil domain-containing protein 148 [Lingula anatina]|eukprot:XP_013383818.1 coiled-coil domain-containing protein 148 [Lingula anatina]
MSGRDYKTFLTNHRTESQLAGFPKEKIKEEDKYVRRFTEGFKTTTYRAMDYEQLKTLATVKKMAAHKSLLKIKKIQQASKEHKDQNLIKQHKLAWQKEFIRLNNARKRLQVEMEAFIRQNAEDGAVCSHSFQDFEDYESSIVNDFSHFKTDTVEPVWNLREDLKYWVVEHQNDAKEEDESVLEERKAILETVASVNSQQELVLEKLLNEQLSLEQELSSGELAELCHTHEKKVQGGIPMEAFELECPDLDLKASVLQEFILLDEQHRARLEDLEQEHAQVLGSERGGWSEEDHYLFQVIVEQYPHDMTNRRMLYIDRLKRHFPGKSRQELVDHEDWCTRHKYYHDRKKALTLDWLRDRKELLTKASATFAEVCMAQELEEVKNEFKQKQKELCDVLYDKVQRWREQKMELMWLEQQEEERKRKEQEELMKIEEEKEKKKRQEQKEKLNKYHIQQEEEQRKRREDEQKRMEELKKILQEQAVHDKERVKFREEQILKKEIAKYEKEQDRLRDEEEREQRLEALREKVRPVVASDPERIWNDTEAWHSRVTGDEDINIQKPLFKMLGFSANQVASDPRVRLEQKLREAGIQGSDYGRLMMKQMKPPTQPRKDMESTVFKHLPKDGS